MRHEFDLAAYVRQESQSVDEKSRIDWQWSVICPARDYRRVPCAFRGVLRTPRSCRPGLALVAAHPFVRSGFGISDDTAHAYSTDQVWCECLDTFATVPFIFRRNRPT